MSIDSRSLINKLPPFSDNVIKLMSALRQDYIKPEELERLLIACPVIAGRVLSLANSSFYGFTRQIETLREACVILGQQTLKNLVYTLAVMDRFQHKDKVSQDLEEPLPQRIWRYSLYNACGVATMVNFAELNMPEAFTSALFENLGLIFLEYFEQEGFTGAFDEANKQGSSINSAILCRFDCSTAGLSYRALEQWHFPESVCEILQDLAQGNESVGTALIRMSHLVSKACGQDLAKGIWPDMPNQSDLDRCRGILSQLPEIIDETASLFDQLSSELL